MRHMTGRKGEGGKARTNITEEGSMKRIMYTMNRIMKNAHNEDNQTTMEREKNINGGENHGNSDNIRGLQTGRQI